MQVIRQSLTTAIKRPVVLGRLQQLRYDGSDPRSSTSSKNHKNDQQTDPASGSNLNKSKGDKKQKSTTTDDTKQPGATRKDWNNPSQTVGNDPQYGKAGSPGDSNNPKRGGN